MVNAAIAYASAKVSFRLLRFCVGSIQAYHIERQMLQFLKALDRLKLITFPTILELSLHVPHDSIQAVIHLW